jgi:hypothetical protein
VRLRVIEPGGQVLALLQRLQQKDLVPDGFT